MGRDKPKKFNKMNHQQKQVYLENELKNFGSSAVYHDNGNGHGMIDLERTQDKFESLSRNDFDYRTSAQHMDGIKGNASARDFVNYQRGAVKLHKQAGNGGDYSSNEDITNVTNNLVKDSQSAFREDMMSDMDAKYATANQLNALQDKIKERAEQSGPTEISSTLTNAQQNIGEHEDELSSQGANIFGAMGPANDLEFATQETEANEASGDGQDYANDYKLNVKGGLQLSGIETRGPNSGIKGEGF